MITYFNRKETLREWYLLFAGCILYTLSTVLIKNINVIPGSFLGIAIALHKAFGVSAGMVNLLLNIPVMAAVTRKLGPKVLAYTVFIMTSTSWMIDWCMPRIPVGDWNVYLLSAAGGALMGIGAGMLLLAEGTMAGTTALTLLIHPKLRRWSFGTILFVVDSLIILTGTLIVRDWRAIPWSMLYNFCCTRAIDSVMALDRLFTRKAVSQNS